MSKKLILTPNAYKAGKVYAVKPINGSGDFDFVRNTGRTRINVNGNIEVLSNNIVALDYQNGCPEILLEPQRTNLFEYSEDFSDSYWDKIGVSLGDDSGLGYLSPQNSNNAVKLIESTSNEAHRIRKINVLNSTENFIASIFVKSAGDNRFLVIRAIQLSTSITPFLIFSPDSGVITSESSNVTGYVLNVGNGWYKVSMSISGEDANSIRFGVQNQPSSILPYLGDGNSGILIWGTQLEESNKPTSYIPTNGSTVTRNKDILSKDLTNIIQPTYTAFLEVVGDEGRLKIEDNDTGIDLPLNGSGKIAIQVDSQIKIIFPDNGQPQTELIYEKPNDLRNIDIVSKLAATRIGVIAIEDGIQDVSNWISGNVSSYFIETDWSAETNLNDEFRDEVLDYFPAIDLSSGTDFGNAWLGNNLTSFPNIDLSSGTFFGAAWFQNNLTSFPANMFDTNTASNYQFTFSGNDLDQQSVDNILISVNTSAQANNITNGELSINGGTNATPSQAGKDAADALFANGWTVDLNGYTPS